MMSIGGDELLNFPRSYTIQKRRLQSHLDNDDISAQPLKCAATPTIVLLLPLMGDTLYSKIITVNVRN